MSYIWNESISDATFECQIESLMSNFWCYQVLVWVSTSTTKAFAGLQNVQVINLTSIIGSALTIDKLKIQKKETLKVTKGSEARLFTSDFRISDRLRYLNKSQTDHLLIRANIHEQTNWLVEFRLKRHWRLKWLTVCLFLTSSVRMSFLWYGGQAF